VTTLPARLDHLDRRPHAAVWPVPDAEPVRLDGAADVLALVGLAVEEARRDARATPLERARTLGMLAGVALKAIEARDLEARVEALERTLKGRAEQAREGIGRWR
jgi:hypothetical protein